MSEPIFSYDQAAVDAYKEWASTPPRVRRRFDGVTRCIGCGALCPKPAWWQLGQPPLCWDETRCRNRMIALADATILDHHRQRRHLRDQQL